MHPVNRLSVLALFLLLLCGVSEARWTHVVPGQAPVLEDLELRFDNPEESQSVLEATLQMELDGSPIEALSASELGAGMLQFVVPGALLDGREFSYRLELNYADTRVLLPASGAWRVALAPRDQLAVVEMLNSPSTDEGDEVLLAFAPLLGEADMESAVIRVDGTELSNVERDPWLVTWSGQLEAGPHMVEIELRNSAGKTLPAQRFQLEVNSLDRVPVGFSAEAWEEFNMDYQKDRLDEWGRYHAGQFRFKAWRGKGQDALTLKGRFLLSALDFESDELQPQSRYTLDLQKQWFKLGLGDRQPDFGEVILYGTRVRGLELGLDWRQFGLNVVAGNTREGLDAIISSDGQSLQRRFSGSYPRQLMGLDLRFGRKHGLIESGLSILKVKDDVDGADVSPADFGFTDTGYSGADFFQQGDTLAALSPVDNVVAALRFNMSALRGRFTARNQVALSLYNGDISGGPITEEELESIGADGLPFKPEDFEDIIVINEYFSPLDIADGDYLNSMALHSNWGLVAGRNEAQLSFRRVGAAYKSLGNAFLTPDRQEIRVNDRFRVLENQVYADLGFALSSNNLDGQYDESVGTMARRDLSLGLGYYPRGRDLQVRLGVELQNEANEARDLTDSDMQQIEGNLLQLRLGLSGSINWLDRRHQWSFNLVNQGYGDDVGDVVGVGDEAGQVRSDRSFSSMQASAGWKAPLARQTGLDLGLAWYNNDYDDQTLTDYGYLSLRAAVNRSWMKGRLKSELRSQLQMIGTESLSVTQDFTRLDLGGQVSWEILDNLQLSSRLEWQGYSGDRDDSYLRVICRLTQSF